MGVRSWTAPKLTELQEKLADTAYISQRIETRLANKGQLIEAWLFLEWSLQRRTSWSRSRISCQSISDQYVCQNSLRNQPSPHGFSGSLAFRYATVISKYAPTMTNLEEMKYKLYKDLKHIIKGLPKQDKCIIIYSSNARFGTGGSHRDEWG